jgi:hypothetical protein
VLQAMLPPAASSSRRSVALPPRAVARRAQDLYAHAHNMSARGEAVKSRRLAVPAGRARARRGHRSQRHPLTPKRFDFRLVADGRMLDCVDRDFTASLRLRDPDDGSALPHRVLLARIDGRLRIVR